MAEIELGELHQRQSDAWHSPATEILYGGAAGGGKSHLMRIMAIVYCLDIPSLQVYLFRRTFPDLWKNHMDGPTSLPVLLAPLIDRKICTINYSKNIIMFKNNSQIHLCHCQHEKDRYNYQGPEIHLLLIDELTLFTEVIYRYIRGRVRLGGLTIPLQYKDKLPKIIASSNPGNIGHNWVKATFIDPVKEYEVWKTPRDEGGFYRQYIPAKLDDNPTIMLSDPDYIQRLEGLGNPELVRAMRDGDWDIIAGGMFDDVWDKNVHIIKPFQVPITWKIDRSFDWGASKPWSCNYWAHSDGSDIEIDGKRMSFPKGTIFAIDELYGWNGKPNEGDHATNDEMARRMAEKDKEISDKYQNKVVPGPADTQIFEAPQGKSISDDFVKWGIYFYEANKKPGSRVSGWQKIRTMLKSSLQFPMEEPGLFVFDNCRQFIRTIPVLPRDERNQDDVDTNAEDHVGDSLRYEILHYAQKMKNI